MKSAVTLLVLCVSSLIALGLVMLYSAGDIFKTNLTPAKFLTTQSIALGIGFLACVAMTGLDYRWLRKFVWVLFGIAVALLVYVLGQKLRNGAARWIPLPFGFNFQPSELAKISLILALAWYCERFQRTMPRFRQGLVIPALFLGPLLALVVVAPDVGTTLLLGAVSFLMLTLAGVRLRYTMLPAMMVGAVLGWFLLSNEVRSKRIHAWLHPEETKQGTGSQAWEARVAFGAGGVTGRGLGSGRQKLGFVAAHHTDFIFPIIGEELGLPATLGVLLMFILIGFAGFFIATRAPDPFGLYVAAGITLLITLQAFVNIAVVTGVFPNKGLPLPFISYGGSSLILMMGCVGILLSIARRGVSSTAEAEEDLPPATALTPHPS